MKIFTNKSVIHKIIAVLIILLLFNFIVPNHTRADVGLGGALLSPILDFLVAIGDGIMWLIQNAIFGINESLIKVSFGTEWWQWVAIIGGAIIATVIAGLLVVATAGLAAAALAAVGTTLTIGFATVAIPSIIAGIVTGVVISNSVLPDDYYLPLYEISPYDIFSNSIPTFDVNFFDPQDSVTVNNGTATSEVEVEISVGERTTISLGGGEPTTTYTFTQDQFDQFKSIYGFSEYGNIIDTNPGVSDVDGNVIAEYQWTNASDGKTYKAYKCNVMDPYNRYDYEYKVSNMREVVTEQLTTEIKSTAGELRNIVSGWYYALRNLALVGLLSVLVYIGIRIVISSTANEKAKYKSMIMDWIIAMCLLFFLHYIMAFSVKIVEKLTEGLRGLNQNAYVGIIQDKDNKIRDAMKESDSTLSQFKEYYMDSDGNPADPNSASDGYLQWETNEIGFARMKLQLEGAKREGSDEDAGMSMMSKASYTIIFLVLIAYTLIFTFTYLKRVLYMAFLTLIAPLVALTYPIDKVNDGQAQAFNTWLKEYLFNLLIQPMHLILYTILIGTAFNFASQNMLYTIVALGFMVPAEKLLRRFFGFEKAHTPGALAGPAGAALMMTGMQNLLRKPPKKHDEEDGKGSGGSKSTNKIRSAETINPMDTLAAKNGENNNNDDNQDKKINMSETNPGLDSGSDETNADPSTKDQNPGRIRMNLTNNGAENNPPHSLEEGPQESPSQLRFKDINNEPTTDPTKIDTSNPANIDPPKVNPPKVNSPKTITKPNGGNRRKLPNREVKKSIGTHIKETAGAFGRDAKSVGKGFRNAGYYYTRKLGNKVRKSHPIRTIRRAGTAAIGGVAMGTLGLVAGIASGDPSKAMQYAATGALAGGKFAKSAGDAIASSSKGGMKAFKQGYLGDQYLEKEQEKLIKEFSRDQKNVDYLMERGYAPKQIRTILNDVAPEYLSEGINDMDDILTGYKLEQGDQANGYEEMDRDEAISTIKMANRLGDTRKSAKAEKEWGERLTKDYKNIDQVQNYYNTDEYKQEQDKIRADYEEKIKKLEKQEMSDAQRKQKMEEAKARRDAMLKEHEDAPASKLANDTIARARRVYDIKDNI